MVFFFIQIEISFLGKKKKKPTKAYMTKISKNEDRFYLACNGTYVDFNMIDCVLQYLCLKCQILVYEEKALKFEVQANPCNR